MRIPGITIERTGDTVRYSSRIGGQELHFAVDAAETGMHDNCADSFMIMALTASMLEGTPPVLEQGVSSPRLIENLRHVQDIYSSWNRQYRRVEIQAEAQAPGPATGEVLSMYSGGLDSMYTLVQHEHELTGVVLVAGFDMELSEEEMRIARERNEHLLRDRGLALRRVETNQRLWGKAHRVDRFFAYSGYLASCALLLGPARLYINAGVCYGFPTHDGCQPYLNPLWSNGRTEVRHTGSESTRAEKLVEIVKHPDLLDGLRVCFRSQNENCGRCAKCVRTMTTLRILGIRGPFPRMLTLEEIQAIPLPDEHDLHFATDNAQLAAARGDRATLKAIKSAIRKYDRQRALLHFDRGFLGGALRRGFRRLKPYDYEDVGFPHHRPDLDL